MADGELEIELDIDEEALEEVEKKQLEVTGEADSVQEAKQQNEESNEKLGVLTRAVFKVVKLLAVVVGFAGLLIPIFRSLGEALDISFEDVRAAIVEAIDVLKQSISDLFTTESSTGLPTNAAEGLAFGFGEGALFPGLGGEILLNALNISQQRQGQGNNQNPIVNLLTSRDQMLGDSTQKEQQTAASATTVNNAGSGDVY